MQRLDRRNMCFFGLGTVGRDMFYAFEANALIYYLSNVLQLPIAVFVCVSLVYTVLRIFDALNDPLCGFIVDNFQSKHGKFKPPMVIGACVGGAAYLVLFTDFGMRDYGFVAVFAVAYIFWDIFYGLNDIAYWSMLPSLSVDQKTREKMGAFARICANIGMFAIMVGWEPITRNLGTRLGSPSGAWFVVALTVTILMLLFQMFTVFGVKEKKSMFQKQEKTTFRQMIEIFRRNDQLLWTTLAMSLFTVGYMTTTTFSIYYMQYVYGDKSMYPVLAAVVGIAQLSALTVFPLVSKHMRRENLYLFATSLILVGYGVFFFANRSLPLIIIAALFIFIAEAFIQLLMLMFLEDTVEYGQWKLHKRNESITLSVQPFINKIGGALSMGFVSISLVWAGIKTGDTAAESISDSGKLIVKLVMLVIPLLFIIAGYLVYRFKFKINKEMYDKIIKDLEDRGEINLKAEPEMQKSEPAEIK